MDMNQTMIERLKVEADYFNLQGLRHQLESPKLPGLDDNLEIDCRGTRVKTTRRVLEKYERDVPGSNYEVLAKLFDPECGEYLTPESDGSVKIDSHPDYIKALVAYLKCKSEKSKDRVWERFGKKYSDNMLFQWYSEFRKK